MNFKLYWTESGDNFTAQALDVELTEWFIETCQNPFNVTAHSLTNAGDTILSDIQQVNSILTRLHLPTIKEPTSLFDQTELNQLHKEWVGIHRREPELDKLLFKIDSRLFDSFHCINNKVHDIEQSFNYALRTVNFQKHINPFVDRQWSPGVFNISLMYSDFGRNSWEKFVNGDSTPNDPELSQWKYIGELVNINLVRPYTMAWPPEFTAWCSQHNIAPMFNRLPLGNITDKHLTQARELMTKNLNQPNNFLRITNS